MNGHPTWLARYTIRACGPADVQVLAAMRRRWAAEQAGESIEDDGFDQRFSKWFERESDQRVTWLAELAGRPVGMLNLLVFTRMPWPRAADGAPRPSQWGYIANVYVEESVRDRGIGGALVSAATGYADEHGSPVSC